jgi:AcrR family transcriptional regulator
VFPRLPTLLQAWDAQQPGRQGPAEDDRERLLAALAKAAAEQGHERLSPELVSRYAGVEVATFHRHFAGVEQALGAGFDAFVDGIWAEIDGSCDGRDIWPLQVRDGLRTLIAALVETSSLARAFSIAARSSLAANEQRLAALRQFAARLREGRRYSPRAASLPEATELMLVSGVDAILTAPLLAEEPQALPGLRPQLTELVLLPYVGPEEARRVAVA